MDSTSSVEDYTGHELDGETGLHYAGARYYMSALGRWTSVDPLADAQHLLPYSPYHYSYNNPLSYTDPDGTNPILRGLKVVKRAYQAVKQGDNLASVKTWKKTVADEWARLVDNVSTLADGVLSADDAFAAIDLVTGFGGKRSGARRPSGSSMRLGMHGRLYRRKQVPPDISLPVRLLVRHLTESTPEHENLG